VPARNGSWGCVVGTYDKDANPVNQRRDLNVAQISETAALSLNSAS
jgi:hypothetical protein